MNNNNQEKIGSATEKFIAKAFKNKGYWAYIIPRKTNGQPCDIFAAKGINNKVIVYLVDAKHVRDYEVSFPFSRIEPNQYASMNYALNFAKLSNLGFVIFFEKDKTLYYLPYQDVLKYTAMGMKSVNMSKLAKFEEILNDEDNF